MRERREYVCKTLFPTEFGYDRIELDLQDKYIREFVERTEEYIEMPKLTAELLQVFIRRIEVFEKAEKYSRTCGNTIIIRCTFESDEAFLATELGKNPHDSTNPARNILAGGT